MARCSRTSECSVSAWWRCGELAARHQIPSAAPFFFICDFQTRRQELLVHIILLYLDNVCFVFPRLPVPGPWMRCTRGKRWHAPQKKQRQDGALTLAFLRCRASRYRTSLVQLGGWRMELATCVEYAAKTSVIITYKFRLFFKEFSRSTLPLSVVAHLCVSRRVSLCFSRWMQSSTVLLQYNTSDFVVRYTERCRWQHAPNVLMATCRIMRAPKRW